MSDRSTTSPTIVCGVASTGVTVVLEAARRLAAAYDAHLIVVHAFDEPVADADRVMTAVRTQTAHDRNVETRLVEGSPESRLLEVARDEAAELVVVGSRGRGAIAAEALGSVSRTLTKSASCPLVIVPPSASRPFEEDPGRGVSIVCGVDGSEHAVAAAVVAGELAGRVGYRLVLVHAPRTPKSMTGYLGRATTPSLSVQPDSAARQSREIIQAALDAVGDQHASAQIEAGDPARVLESVAQRENGRMIVVASRGIGAAHAAVFGSVTLSLLASAAVPLVIVSEAAERARALRRSTAEAAFLR